jgi:hypothetical protein
VRVEPVEPKKQFITDVMPGDLVAITASWEIKAIQNPCGEMVADGCYGIFLGTTLGPEGVRWPSGLHGTVIWVLPLGPHEFDSGWAVGSQYALGPARGWDWSAIRTGRVVSGLRDAVG